MSLRLILLCILTINVSCHHNGSEEAVEESRNKFEDSSANNEKNDWAESCNVSSEFIEFISVLEQDNYKIDKAPQIDTLKFQTLEDLRVTRSRNFLSEDFSVVLAKRQSPLNRMEGNWFPNFHVFEICFESDQMATHAEKDLNAFINSDDIYNSKNYDYIVRHGNRIVYVTCKAKIFEDHAFKYQSIIEDIVKSQDES